MRTINVDLGERSYAVHVGRGLIEKLPELISRRSTGPDPSGRCAVLLTDDRVGNLYGDAVEKILVEKFGRTLTIGLSSGETSKSLAVMSNVLERMAEERVRRTDVLVALGGGVVCDVGGFAGSIYQRGIDVVNVPTSLLSQVDAAIGGKTGINLSAGKNLAGSFHQPKAVICDVVLLESLSAADFRSGMAEVAKYGFCFDPEMLQTLAGASAGDTDEMERLVARSVEHKARLVEIDEFDRGERNKLNYGHTLGHALEAYGGYERWSHGEAISIGMVFAAALSEETGTASSNLIDKHREALGEIGLPVAAEFDPERVKGFLQIDKKHSVPGGTLRWVLLEDLGRAVMKSDVDEAAIDSALKKVMSK
ncbi:MAG: 3-dehydroquinate synthase [Acidimicrobiia bacterium]